MEEVEYRICSKCGERKELCKENYACSKRDGWRTYCKECGKIDYKRYCAEKRKKAIDDISTETTRICSMCGVEKELNLDNFLRRGETASWRRECKECFHKRGNSRDKSKENQYLTSVSDPNITKKCNCCGETKILCNDNFRYQRNRCRECERKISRKFVQENQQEVKAKRKDYKLKNKEIIKIQNKIYCETHRTIKVRDPDVPDGMKRCTMCGCVKTLCLDNFYKRKEGKWRSECNDCNKIRNHQHYLENKDKISIRNKLYRETHKEEIKAYCRKRNKLKSTPQIKENKTINRRLRKQISTSILDHLKQNKHNKGGKSCLQFLSYTMDEFRLYIESLFEPWMNWGNHGVYHPKAWDNNDSKTWRWQLDHIIPHSNFIYTSMDCEEFRKCWALENLRPYSAKQNVLDGNRRNIEKLTA